MDLTHDIDFKDYYTSVINGWWLITFLAVVGGILGLIFSLYNPPIYEARSVLYVGNDFTLIDRNKISDSDMDYIISKSSSLVNNGGILDQLIDEYKAKGIEVDIDAFSLERRLGKWDLIVHHTDSKVAADLANGWLESAYVALDEARQNSLIAYETNLKLETLIGCSKEKIQSSYCAGIISYAQLSDEIDRLMEQLDIVEKKSRGITGLITFEKGGAPVVSSKPIVYKRNSMILIGCFLGALLSSIILVVNGDLAKWRNR